MTLPAGRFRPGSIAEGLSLPEGLTEEQRDILIAGDDLEMLRASPGWRRLKEFLRGWAEEKGMDLFRAPKNDPQAIMALAVAWCERIGLEQRLESEIVRAIEARDELRANMEGE